MSGPVLVTGAEGLIGRALCGLLAASGERVVRLDLRGEGDERGDVCERGSLGRALRGCRGVVHLAAVSRVVWGERDPQACLRCNVGGTRNVIELALGQARPPWVLVASSREVYGQPDALPAGEDTPLRPINVYGRSKAEAERLLLGARPRGLVGAVVRLSNVYGSALDHRDRVIPAFARAAAGGSELRVDGAEHTFDFTHVSDVVEGIRAIAMRLDAGGSELPPLQLVTGEPTSLGALARLAVELAGSRSPIVQAPPRSYDVARFVGDGRRAEALLGWRPRVPLRQGFLALIDEVRAEAGGGQPGRRGGGSGEA